MLEIRHKVVAILSVFILATGLPAFAMDDDLDGGAAEKARQAHERASSDMIYQNEEWKALYYQNEQVIQLLKQIRDTLEVIKQREGMNRSEEKKI